MKRRMLLSVLVSMLVIVSLLAACAPSAPAEEPAVEAPVVEEPAVEVVPCDFDEQTCDFLAGKDFTGQTLVVGVWGGVIEDIYRTHVIPQLEAQGASVELLLGGTGDRMAKIYAEKGDPTMDIAYLNIYECVQAMNDGVTEAPSADVPAFNDLYPPAQIGGYGMSFAGLGIAYNPDVFDSPPNWADLWAPEHAGKIAFPNFPGSDGEGFMAIAARLAGADETNPDVAFEKLSELKPVALVYTDLDELFMQMDRGDIVAAAVFSGYAWTYIDRGMNIAFSWADDPGTVMLMDTLTIVEGTKHRELALAWTQLSLSPKVQTAFAEEIYFGPTNSTVVLEGLVAERSVYGEETIDSLLRLNWDWLIQNRDQLVDRWNRFLEN